MKLYKYHIDVTCVVIVAADDQDAAEAAADKWDPRHSFRVVDISDCRFVKVTDAEDPDDPGDEADIVVWPEEES